MLKFLEDARGRPLREKRSASRLTSLMSSSLLRWASYVLLLLTLVFSIRVLFSLNMGNEKALERSSAESSLRDCPTCLSRIGSAYGGWFYFPNDVSSENAVIYSFGLGQDLSWDLAMLHRHDCDIWGFDSTPKSLRYWNEEKKDKTKWRRFHHPFREQDQPKRQPTSDHWHKRHTWQPP